MKDLNEGKKKKASAYMAELAEIDKQSAIVAMEAKINHLQEMADKKNERLKMVSEDENLSELIDSKKKKSMEREIKEIEKAKAKLEKVYEKMSGGKKKEIVDEDKEDMDETYSASTYEEDDSVSEGGYDSNYEEDDSMNEEFLRMQKLAGVISEEEYKKKLNEESAGVFSGWADDMLGMEEPTFPKGTELKLRSKADAGKTSLTYYFQLADKKGDGNLQMYITVGDEPSIKYRAKNLDDNKVKAYIDKRKDDFVRYFDFIAGQNSKEEMGKKYHVGGGYEDKVTDEDVASIKDGIKKLKSLKIETF